MQENSPNPEFILSPALNERAVALVINSVIRYPQAGDSAAIMADHLMDEYGPASARTTGVGVREAVRVQPDPADTAARINRVHERFGINYQVTSDQADHIVHATALMGIDHLRWTLQRIGRWNYWDNPVPLELVEMPLFVGDSNGPVRPLQALPAAADALHAFLSANPTLREETATALRTDAERLRPLGKDWRRQVQYNHAHGKPLR